MSLLEQAPHMALEPGSARTMLTAISRSYRLPVYLGCTVLALIANFLLGKDMPFDTLNYHLYAGFSALHDRFDLDYFGAGATSYFAPYVYAPFYILVSSGLSGLAISSMLAGVHSIILWLTFELALLVCPSSDVRSRLTVGVCAVALAFLNPILLQQIGSSFADITTGTMVLGGWLLLARAVREPRTTWIVCAGALLGVAVALKLTNAVHALAAFALFIKLPRTWTATFRQVLGFGTAMGLGFVLIAAPWSYRLERMFGNPFFPLLNSLFRSSEFTTEPLGLNRFVPETLAAALWRPFAILDPVRMVHEEMRAPQVCYAALAMVAMLLCLRWLWRRLRQSPNPPPSAEPASVRVLAALVCGLAVDWILWLRSSGNGRYFLPMASVAAVVMVALLFRFFLARPKVRNYLLAAIFALQAIELCYGSEFRWQPVPWDGPWFSVAIPEKLSREANLYLTVGTQSNSFLAPYLAPGSGLINFAGGYALSADGATGARVHALINRFSPGLRVLVRGERLFADDELRSPRRSDIDQALAPFGLRVDMSDCAVIVVHGLPRDFEVTITGSARTPGQLSPQTTDLVSCRLTPDATDRAPLNASRSRADLVLDRLEDACPELFQPRRLLTEHSGDAWLRRYINSDITAWVSRGWVKFQGATMIRGGPMIYIGREADWAKAPLKVTCGNRDGHYFAHVLQTQQEP